MSGELLSQSAYAALAISTPLPSTPDTDPCSSMRRSRRFRLAFRHDALIGVATWLSNTTVRSSQSLPPSNRGISEYQHCFITDDTGGAHDRLYPPTTARQSMATLTERVIHGRTAYLAVTCHTRIRPDHVWSQTALLLGRGRRSEVWTAGPRVRSIGRHRGFSSLLSSVTRSVSWMNRRLGACESYRSRVGA